MHQLERYQRCEVEYIDDLHSYINTKTQSIEVLYLFKCEFGQLIDPYIIAIFLNREHISIVRDIPAVKRLDYGDHGQYMVQNFPLDFFQRSFSDHPTLSEHLSTILHDRDQSAELKLQTHAHEAVSKGGSISITQHITKFIKTLCYVDILELYLFGDNAKANQLLDAQIEKDQTIENYQEAINHLIDHIQLITEKSSTTIFKRLYNQIKSNLIELPANDTKGVEAKTRWDEVGMLSENKNDEIGKLCSTAFYALNETEQLAVKLNLIKPSTVKIDQDQTLSDIDTLVDVEVFMIHLMQTLIHNARIDWSDKVW